MESKSKGLWIFIVIVAGFLLLCCCGLLAVGAVGVPSFLRSVVPWEEDRPWLQVDWPREGVMERIEESFEVGRRPELVVSSFAGSITIETGDEDAILVVATKHARGASRLDGIDVRMSAEGDRVEIVAKHDAIAGSNMWVEMEITVPAETELDLNTGAGAIEVVGVQGAMRIEAGAGGIEILDASGPVSVQAGAGGIEYTGRPSGDCRFEAGAGGITLRIPSDSNVRVDLSAGLGGVRSDLRVDGTVTVRSVRGTIGSGDEGSITASAGVGGVELLRR